MVLEFVPGESLHERLRRLANEGGRMAPAQAAAIAADVASAIGYAHEEGLIHRDIQPANIMLGERGQTVLMDFGVAKIIGATQHTATGAVVGTAFYISPELVRGEPPSPQSDIYALGASLFEMLAGRPPFMGDSAMSVMLKHINESPPDLRHIAPEAAIGLVQTVEKALAKDPGQRFQTAGAMAEALRRSGEASALERTEQKEPVLASSGASAATVIDDEPAGPAVSTAGAPVVVPATVHHTLGAAPAAPAARDLPAAQAQAVPAAASATGAPSMAKPDVAGTSGGQVRHRGGRS
jgi:eukaryotic-like serine/threonine-protein kinase